MKRRLKREEGKKGRRERKGGEKRRRKKGEKNALVLIYSESLNLMKKTKN